MRRRLAGLALALYPLAFRRRYGEELRALLEQEPPGPRALLDLLAGALRAHLRPPAGLALEPEIRLRLALGGVLACWVAFAAAGLAFYKTTENDPFGASAALGGAHLGVQVLAVLAGGALLAGALPLVAIALPQALQERGRLLALVLAPIASVLTFAGLTALLVLGAHGRGAGAARGAFVVWVLGGAGCAAVFTIAARRVVLAIEVPPAWLRSALAWATAVALAMAAITVAVALYAIALQLREPAVARGTNGPFGAPEADVSILLQALWMGLFSAFALLGVWRGRRAAAQR